jgi:EAL domain-containing protein (putative c-di-GMP-specific phosphodiesterase class I)
VLEVNLSGKSLGDVELLELIERELQRSGVSPRTLIFEVTETAAVANIDLARRFAERLTELGCRFALDDFGAGFDSFYYLKYLPFDYLKIDGEFITNCTRNRTDQLVIQSLISVARGLGKQTIAEFVEDRETELFLRREGVDLAQGYHVARPVPVAEVLCADQPSARVTSSSAIASEEVAAGEGALRTQVTPCATASRKSSTSAPS